jgi:hypothetical protein
MIRYIWDKSNEITPLFQSTGRFEIEAEKRLAKDDILQNVGGLYHFITTENKNNIGYIGVPEQHIWVNIKTIETVSTKERRCFMAKLQDVELDSIKNPIVNKRRIDYTPRSPEKSLFDVSLKNQDTEQKPLEELLNDPNLLKIYKLTNTAGKNNAGSGRKKNRKTQRKIKRKNKTMRNRK